jgi:hypothetical protein
MNRPGGCGETLAIAEASICRRLLRLLRKSHEHRHADQMGARNRHVRALLRFL